MTDKDTLQGNENLIQEMLRDAKLVNLPSELRENPVIHRGDETLDAPMTVKELTSAGYVYVWDTRTYERAPVLYYMLSSILRRRREDGSFIWTTNDPKKLPFRGTFKCPLHGDTPNRALYNKMGLRTCKKSNIINEFEVKQHMMMKHPKEWRAIEELRIEKEKQEDREFQKALYTAVAGKKVVGSPEAPLYVSTKDKKNKNKQ